MGDKKCCSFDFCDGHEMRFYGNPLLSRRYVVHEAGFRHHAKRHARRWCSKVRFFGWSVLALRGALFALTRMLERPSLTSRPPIRSCRCRRTCGIHSRGRCAGKTSIRSDCLTLAGTIARRFMSSRAEVFCADGTAAHKKPSGPDPMSAHA